MEEKIQEGVINNSNIAVIAETPQRESSSKRANGIMEEVQVPGGSEAQIMRLIEDPPSAKTITVFHDLMQYLNVNTW